MLIKKIYNIRNPEKDTMLNSLIDKTFNKICLNEKTRHDLMDFYKNDILYLEQLLGKDLSIWTNTLKK